MYFVEIEVLALEQLQRALGAVFAEDYFHTCWEVEIITHKQLSFLVVALIAGHPHESKHSFFERLTNRNTANGVSIRPRKRFHFINLKISVLIVERLCCSRICHGGNIVVVLELPIGPASEVDFH